MQPKYADLIENSGAFRVLLRDIEQGRLSHAYLLLSPDRLALDTLCDMFLARAIAGDYESAHARAVFNHTLGDIIRLPQEGDKVRVGDINSLTESAYFTPTELKRKYYVISHGETMNEPSQNKLLKTLEEPPEVTGIIIKAASENKLLPTVLSRCRKVVLEPFTSDALYDALAHDYPRESLSLAAECSRGLLTSAVQMASSPTYIKLYEVATDLLTKLNGSGGIAEHAFKLYDYRENLTDIIDFIELLLRDALKVHAGADGDERAHEIALRYGENAVLKEFEVLARARRRIELNGNVTAIIDEMLFSMMEVRAKWK